MTLVQLRHLIALADSGSFSKAAAAAFVTQPALSRSIRALEDELRMPLIDRVGRRFELTPFGRETLARARQLVFDADELRTTGHRVRGAASGTLRVGMVSGPGAVLAAPLLLEIATAHPGLNVQVSRGETDALVQALRARALDALVADARWLRPASDLRAEFVFEMRGAFLVRRGHPLTRRRGGVRFAALHPYPIASTPLSDEVARLLVERYGAMAHPDECVRLRCDEIQSLVALTRESDAVLLTVRAAAPDLVELRMNPPLAVTARFGLVTLARRTEAPALAIVRMLMERLLRD